MMSCIVQEHFCSCLTGDCALMLLCIVLQGMTVPYNHGMCDSTADDECNLRYLPGCRSRRAVTRCRL